MNDKNLPPLPEPQKTVCIVDSERGLSWTYWRTPAAPVFTADQMRAYARAALASPAAQAQPVALTVSDSQFLTDVMTVAGLVSHGRQDKALGARLGEAVMRIRSRHTAPEALAPDAPGPSPMTSEWVAVYPKSAAWMINTLAQRLDALAAHPVAGEVQRHAPAEQPEREAAVVKESLTGDELTDVAREPLSDEQIDCIKQGPSQDYRAFARAIERAHGIPARVDSEGSK